MLSDPLVWARLLFSCWVVSDSLWSHGLQHTRLPCPSLSPGICSNSHPLSRWCHPAISSSVTPFSSCPQSFPTLGSFPMSCLFPSWGQSIRASASASVLPMDIQVWFSLGLTGLILQFKGLSKVFSSITVRKHHSLAPRLSYDPTLTSDSHFIVLHDHMFIGILGLIVVYLSSYLSVLWPPSVSF